MPIRPYDTSSTVEERELSRGPHRIIYPPVEKIRVVEVETFPSLGRLAALRFVEWTLKNPGGVVALPTGKTPEYFIKWVRHLLANWARKDARALLEEYGVGSARPPVLARSVVRPDRRVLPDRFAPAQQLQPLREGILSRRVRLRPRARAPDRFDVARAPPWEDDGRGVPRQRRRPVAADEAPAQRARAHAEGRDQPRRRVLHELRSEDPGDGRDRILPRRHRPRRPHRVQRPGVGVLFGHAADRHQLRNAGRRGRRPRAASRSPGAGS